MAAASDFLETKLRDHFRNRTQLVLYDTYVALYTAGPTDAGGGTEVTGGAYARKKVNQDGATAPYWTTLGTDAMQNAQLITFATSSAVWGLISHVGIRDALTGGNLLFHGPLATAIQVNSGAIFEFPINALQVKAA